MMMMALTIDLTRPTTRPTVPLEWAGGAPGREGGDGAREKQIESSSSTRETAASAPVPAAATAAASRGRDDIHDADAPLRTALALSRMEAEAQSQSPPRPQPQTQARTRPPRTLPPPAPRPGDHPPSPSSSSAPPPAASSSAAPPSSLASSVASTVSSMWTTTQTPVAGGAPGAATAGDGDENDSAGDSNPAALVGRTIDVDGLGPCVVVAWNKRNQNNSGYSFLGMSSPFAHSTHTVRPIAAADAIEHGTREVVLRRTKVRRTCQRPRVRRGWSGGGLVGGPRRRARPVFGLSRRLHRLSPRIVLPPHEPRSRFPGRGGSPGEGERN